MKTTADLKEKPSAAKLSRRGGRETVDALVVAFVLAFLIRTYVAEAFVIPTGSMAPTLMGQHKDVFCDQCGTRFKVNASDDTTEANTQLARSKRELQVESERLQQEVAAGRVSPQSANRRFQQRQRELAQMAEQIKGLRCVGGECPQCRYLTVLDTVGTESVAPEWASEIDQTANYSGDRLVVSKYSYSFENPDRWDVAVFKYPGNSQVNYIKRITGLPGEELRIFQGDIYTRPLDAEEDFQIARKPAKQVMAMRQFVHDTHNEPTSLIDAGWPLAWSSDAAWTVDKELAISDRQAKVYWPSYSGEAAANATSWLRYHHLPPSENVWRRILGEGEEITVRPKPQLITDFTPYNTRLNLSHARQNVQRGRGFSLAPRAGRFDDLGRIGVHWVSDLMVEADVSANGTLSLDLVKAGDHYGVSIDSETGRATFWRRAFETDLREEIATAETSFRAGSEHQVRLANFDDQLMLWIDGSQVDVDATYQTSQSSGEGPAELPQTSETDAGDLEPVGLGISGGKATVSRLRVWRDGYYFAATADSPGPGGPRSGYTSDLMIDAFEKQDQANWRAALQEMPSNTNYWYALANRRRVDFRIDETQFFVMGDNSGWSLDARLWAGGNGRDGGQPGGPYLERSQLVGKAICVYWPHAWYSLPGTNRVLPIWPNFGDMRLVR